MLTPQSDGMQASFASSMPGTYKVTATVTDAGGSSSQTFMVIVDSPITPNTAPRCKINALQTGVFTHDTIPLEAVLEDDEQPGQELSVTWSVSAGTTLSSTTDRRVAFSADAAAVYEVSCEASDGLITGPRTSLSLSVFDRPQNSPPKLLFVAPTTATVTLSSMGAASQILSAAASDVDGDAISIEFTLLEGQASLSEADSPADSAGKVFAARRFEATVPGPYSVLVRAVDQNQASSESMVVRLLVADSLDRTDRDQDGFPASVDCDDMNPRVFPTAPEIWVMASTKTAMARTSC
jgi:hypothetical protein